MTYQKFQNEQPTMPSQPRPALSSATGMQQHHNDKTTVVSGGPYPTSHAVVSPWPHNPFLQRARKTKRLGIAILIIGIITFFFGIIMIFATKDYLLSYFGGGIWSGIFIIIAGSLTIGAGANANIDCLRFSAMVLCIFELISVFSCGAFNIMGFGIGLSCNGMLDNHCEYNYVGAIMSLILVLLNLVVFIITLIATVNLGKGCCSYSSNQGAVIIQQGAAGYSVAASTNNYHQQQQHQAPMQHECVTYGADYNQQQPQQIPKEEQKIQLDDLPSRSGGY